jgi:uncharacterized protein YeaO (DUF488 family)
MAVRIVRLGTPRAPDEGLRIGTVRRPPRGVRKQDFAKRDFYDVWLPDLAPSAELLSWATATRWTPAQWKRFTSRYLREMRRPEPQRIISLLAALSRGANFSVGCYCEDASHCHRSLLRDLLAQHGATFRAGL